MLLYNKDHVTLGAVGLVARQLTEVNPARPFLWDHERGRFVPRTLAQALHSHHRDVLLAGWKRAQPQHVPRAGATVVAHAVDIEQEASRRFHTDHQIDGVARRGAGHRAISFYGRVPNTAVQRVRG